MRSFRRKYDFYLDDILKSMLRITEYIEGNEFNEFKKNYLIVDAVVRNFEIIGEASKNIPENIQEKYPEIPRKKMYGLRNMKSHEYFGIDYEMLWEIATGNLPQNILDLQRIIYELKNTN
jgi:uncharacterized protein with HEPN domain